MARAALLALAALLIAFTGSAHAAPTWLDPNPVSPPSDPVPTEDLFTFGAKVAFDPSGNALLVWPRQDATTQRIQAAFRPAGGSFSAPVDISEVAAVCAGCGLDVQVAFDAQGNALAAWNQMVGANLRVKAGFRPAGAPCRADNRCGFGAPATLSADGEEACCPKLAFDRFGNALVGWGGSFGGGALQSRVAFRPAEGSFGAPDTISTGNDQNGTPAIDFDQSGNAIAVWISRNETNPDFTERTLAAVRPANGSFGTPENLTLPAPACDCPILTDVEFGPNGRALAVWPRFDGTDIDPADGHYRVEVADQLAPGSAQFGTPARSSAADQDAGADAGLDLDVDSSGNALAVWTRSDGTNNRVQAAFRAPGGSFVQGVNISPAGEGACCASVKFGPRGNAIALWEQQLTGTNQRIYAGNRPAGASCTAADACGFTYHDVSLAGDGSNALGQTLDFDAQGNAIAAWSTIVTINGADVGRVFAAAGYDDAGPQLRAQQFPSSPSRTPLLFSVTPVDVWSPVVSTTWSFGDGGTAVGATVRHSYASPGRYLATVTSTDAVGNSSRAQRVVVITDTARPRISRLRVAPARFRAAARGPRSGARVGSRIRFRLSEPARVRFRVERATRGRRVRGRCRRETARNRTRRRCTRYVRLRGSFTRRGREGANSLRFRGRLRGRKLRRGRYRLAARATDPSGNRSATRRARFRIVRR